MKRFLWGLLLVLSMLAGTASAQTAVWRQPWDNRSTTMWSAKTTDGSIDQEIADDFDLIGRIDSLFVQGGYITYFNSPTMNLQGAYVRFYASQNGVPGALQYEQFVPGSAIATTRDEVGNMSMQMALPASFTASGKHFVSVQAVADMGWSWHSANTASPKGAFMMTRDRKAGTGWSVPNQSDAALVLFGAITGAPRLDSVSDLSMVRSGRVRIFGTNFGEVRNGGRVVIGGIDAIVSRWTMTTIHAYVPEAAALGSNTVQVVTATGGSVPATLNVTSRTSPGGRAKWRFQADSIQITSKPLVGPDGTVYVMDDYAHLYALTPDGGLKWMTVAGGQGSRLTQGSDGTLYTMADGRLTAIRPDGTLKWIFTHPDMSWTVSGPTVGPDGNIYGVVQNGLGFFSVTPTGQLRWSNPRVGDRTPRGHAIVFSNGQAYINHRHLDYPNQELQAYGMADGRLRWVRDADSSSQPLIGPSGRIYVENLMGVWYSVIYNPDGSVFLNREGSIGPRSFSPDLSKLYTRAFQSTQLAALNSLTLNSIWTYTSSSFIAGPTADPFDRILLSQSYTNYGTSQSLMAVTTGGQYLWREELPFENGGYVQLSTSPAFSPDGQTAYLGTIIPAQDMRNGYCYLYAFGLDTTATTQLSSLSLSPSTVNEGGSSTGTVRLTAAAPAGGAVVTLSSDNAVAKVPAAVTIPAGATSATFTVTTGTVQFSQGSMIRATYNGVATSANLMINDVAAPVTDTVRISRAEFSRRTLRVEASSTVASSTLRVYNATTGALIGTLANRSGRYSGSFSMATAPQTINVRSSDGGSATATVTVR
jgi:hypothetical protein